MSTSMTADVPLSTGPARESLVSMPTVTSTVMAVILLGLAAGFFVTYTISVTRGLTPVSDLAYVEVFQAINDRVRTPQFAAFFFGSVPVTALAAYLTRGTPAGWLLAAALALYVVAVSGVTHLGNIPLHQELATHAHLNPDIASQARSAFEARWNTLNLIRALGSLGSLTLAATALATLSRVVR